MYDVAVFAGTAESAEICQRLCDSGKRILLCTATDETLTLPQDKLLSRHCGRLDTEQMGQVLLSGNCRAVICAVHPYASEARNNIRTAAETCGLPCLCYIRPESYPQKYTEIITPATNHTQAAKLAFSFGKPVLLTTGSNHATTYLTQARKTGIPILARVLNSPHVQELMQQAGFKPEECIFGRGPFNLQENLLHIRRAGAGVLVTKDGGNAGGFIEKLQAAAQTDCRVILISRPLEDLPESTHTFSDIATLTDSTLSLL